MVIVVVDGMGGLRLVISCISRSGHVHRCQFIQVIKYVYTPKSILSNVGGMNEQQQVVSSRYLTD